MYATLWQVVFQCKSFLIILNKINNFRYCRKKYILLHSAEFTEAAASNRGMRGMLDAAKAMAMTVADLLSDPEKLAEVKKEFSDDSD